MSPRPLAAGERRGSKAALFPLTVMALVAFVPTYRSCSDEPFRSPLQFAAENVFSALWVAPVFVFAGVFALLTAFALRRGAVDRLTRRLGLAALGAFAVAELGFGVAAVAGKDNEWPWLVSAAVATGLAAVLVRRARAQGPWQIWEHLVAAFAVLAVATGPTVILGGELLHGSTSSLGPGAYLYVAALAALLGLQTWAVVRARSTV